MHHTREYIILLASRSMHNTTLARMHIMCILQLVCIICTSQYLQSSSTPRSSMHSVHTTAGVCILQNYAYYRRLQSSSTTTRVCILYYHYQYYSTTSQYVVVAQSLYAEYAYSMHSSTSQQYYATSQFLAESYYYQLASSALVKATGTRWPIKQLLKLLASTTPSSTLASIHSEVLCILLQYELVLVVCILLRRPDLARRLQNRSYPFSQNN